MTLKQRNELKHIDFCILDATACLEAFKDEYSKATGADQQLAMINSVSKVDSSV